MIFKEIDNMSNVGAICHYFVRPHMGLKGGTPVEAAGVGIDEEYKWLGLIEKSARRGN
jgi:hypothetical protein